MQQEQVNLRTIQNRIRKRSIKKIRSQLACISSKGDEIIPNIQAAIVWSPPPQPVYTKPVFEPAYFGGENSCGHAINAIIEIRAIWAYVICEAYYNYRDMYSKLSLPLKKEVILECQKHKEEFAVYDRERKMWLIVPNEPDYIFCYNGNNFEEFEIAKDNITGNRILLVGKYTILQQEPKLLRETSTAENLFKTFRIPSRSLTVGVPGCGKTTYIINNHSQGSLVLTSCAEGAQDIRSRMAKIYGGDANHYRGSYRTIDSYLINSRRQFSSVWLDEALMEHPGKIFLVCLFSQCSALSLLGDPNQLPYINRLKEVNLLYDKSSIFFKPTKTLNISYRCPVDVMGVLSLADLYDGGAHSASKVLHSLKGKMFKSLKDIPKSEDAKYLVFKQAEKKKLDKAGYDVSTVHEFQGKEAAHVVLVRMSRKLKEPLYRSEPHILVGMTRHKKTFTYYTPVTDDLKKLIDRVSANVNDAQLKKYQVNTVNSIKSNNLPLITTSLSSTSYSSQPTQSSQHEKSYYAESSSSYHPMNIVNTSKSNIPLKTTSLTSMSYSSQSTPSLQPKQSYYPESSYSLQPAIYSTSYNSTHDNNPAFQKPRGDKPSVLRPIIKIVLVVTFAYMLKRWFSTRVSSSANGLRGGSLVARMAKCVSDSPQVLTFSIS